MAPALILPGPQPHILAKPFELVTSWHTYVVRCTCPAQTVITIIGDGMGPACPECGEQPLAALEQTNVKLGHRRREILQ